MCVFRVLRIFRVLRVLRLARYIKFKKHGFEYEVSRVKSYHGMSRFLLYSWGVNEVTWIVSCI